jgi:pyridine nucleotide-disulfide oxidoreductase family protein
MAVRRILLIGSGQGHLEVLRRFAQKPDLGIDLTLASPNALCPYSAMLPGIIAGHHDVGASHVELPSLAHWAGARFICDRAVELDLYTRIVRLDEGGIEPFDLLSLDIGPSPDLSVPGVREHALSLHPTDRFLAGWAKLQDDAAAGQVRTVAVVGSGATVIELLLAMQFRLAADLGAGAPRFALITEAPRVLPEHIPAVRKRLGKILVARDVVLHTASAVTAVMPGGLLTATGRRIAADRIVWATSAAGAPWLATSGLACDPRGFVRVNALLQSVSDPFVFAVGDCATQDAAVSRRLGVPVPREGAALAANLRHAARHQPLVASKPRQSRLSIITTGPRHAVASWGPMLSEGERVWRWKDRLDRAYLARYHPPSPKTEEPGPPQ